MAEDFPKDALQLFAFVRMIARAFFAADQCSGITADRLDPFSAGFNCRNRSNCKSHTGCAVYL